jgi:DNA-binding beta-propeller fold protein YncE
MLMTWAELFVTNVLNGTVAAGGDTVNRGTVLRILLAVPDGFAPIEVLRTVIGSGFMERTDLSALVIGPTGVGLGPDGTLYVADTLANRIAAIPNRIDRRRAEWSPWTGDRAQRQHTHR